MGFSLAYGPQKKCEHTKTLLAKAHAHVLMHTLARAKCAGTGGGGGGGGLLPTAGADSEGSAPAFLFGLQGDDADGAPKHVAVAGRRSSAANVPVAAGSGSGSSSGATASLSATGSRKEAGFASITDGLKALDDTLSLFTSGRLQN